jgi:hypothetical protein
MFADIRNFNEMTMLGQISPMSDWAMGSPSIPTGDLSGNYADASTTCQHFGFSTCWHSPSDVANA